MLAPPWTMNVWGWLLWLRGISSVILLEMSVNVCGPHRKVNPLVPALFRNGLHGRYHKKMLNMPSKIQNV